MKLCFDCALDRSIDRLRMNTAQMSNVKNHLRFMVNHGKSPSILVSIVEPRSQLLSDVSTLSPKSDLQSMTHMNDIYHRLSSGKD